MMEIYGMMRRSLLSRLLFLKAIVLLIGSAMMPTTAKASNDNSSAYDFTFQTLSGVPMPLSQYKGKVLMIVNTASQCGFTQQYRQLEDMWEKYKDRGLVVIGVPSNDFGAQEPGSNEEIAHFCKLNYGVTFPMASKEAVTGKDAHPFYQWAAAQGATSPKWNFHKYLIDTNGKLIDWFASITKPDDEKIIRAIESHLPKPETK
jgi:glutathione peroxidase